ncbi:hypothetical protein BCF44_1151, partial [Kutzneria buriramensis]
TSAPPDLRPTRPPPHQTSAPPDLRPTRPPPHRATDPHTGQSPPSGPPPRATPIAPPGGRPTPAIHPNRATPTTPPPSPYRGHHPTGPPPTGLPPHWATNSPSHQPTAPPPNQATSPTPFPPPNHPNTTPTFLDNSTANQKPAKTPPATTVSGRFCVEVDDGLSFPARGAGEACPGKAPRRPSSRGSTQNRPEPCRQNRDHPRLGQPARNRQNPPDAPAHAPSPSHGAPALRHS